MGGGAKVHNVPTRSGAPNIRKKRKMSAASDERMDAASSSSSAVSGGRTFTDGASETARRRWRLLQKHVCITRWLSKDLMQRHLKRFALSQQAIVDAVMNSKDDFMEVFVKIRVRDGYPSLATSITCADLDASPPLSLARRRNNSCRCWTPRTASSSSRRSGRCSSSTAARSTRRRARRRACCRSRSAPANRCSWRARRRARTRRSSTASRTSTSGYVIA